ncbi:class I SAM-dependent methyltransferase [Halalkalibacter sp. APA_J-10(15)]|uniref:class I SAM-dependent methyltransferase n=1 Tax=unclassified Halalkalibacter TaxID=2893063 RepID=UPI001FF6CC0E|nr:class I SAM-dependent methyltransferase [Halalkalibacter sp. APA_J-10(15)]MCK0471042.1 class I SAM-dependent methyltransferase [Halalkalibacter sp. APA_J-10(15)]
MKERIRGVFDQLASVYENNIDKKGLYNSEYERPAMMRLLPNNLSDKTVLDAGCAAGWYTQQLMNRGATTVATDISLEMVNATRRRVGEKAKVHRLDLGEKLPFESQSFDLILSSLTLHYIKDWERTFSEFQRVLKPNGMFLFSVHHPFADIAFLKDPHYFSIELIFDQWNKEGKVYEVPFYRRPLSEIVNCTSAYFSIEELIEPQPTMSFKEQAPEKYDRLMKRPQFLMIKAINH